MNTLDVQWTEALERDLKQIFREVRTLPPISSCESPELLCVAAREEHRYFREFIQKVRLALTRHAAPALDLEIVERVAQLRDRIGPR